MFIKDGDSVKIKVYYIKKGYRFVTYTQDEFKKSIVEEDEKREYSCVSVEMMELTWGLYNQLQEDAMIDDASGRPQFNVKVYKENRLLKLIKSWDAIDDDGNLVPVNKNTISHMAPDIAETILRAYDEYSFISEEEEGK